WRATAMPPPARSAAASVEAIPAVQRRATCLRSGAFPGVVGKFGFMACPFVSLLPDVPSGHDSMLAVLGKSRVRPMFEECKEWKPSLESGGERRRRALEWCRGE